MFRSLFSFTSLFLLSLSNGIVIDSDGSSAKHRVTKLPDLFTATVEDLANGLGCGDFSSVDLVNAYIRRISEVNSTLHAVVELNPDALIIAKRLDSERKAHKLRGPLHGLPILIKNNIATNDKLTNTAGSYALLGAKVLKDSEVARKLRDAGVVILGKTNLSQWANFRSFNSTNGWSAYGGQTTGAYYPKQDPSGSSSGSGVASSIGLAVAALGTETDGSIISPSSANNVVGIKPTVGLVSRSLVIPISQRQDTVGPMARTVKDAAYVLSAIAGKDKDDNYTSAIPFKTIPNYVAACNINALKGKRIGVPRNIITENSTYPPVAAFEQAITVIRKAGAIVVDNLGVTSDSLNEYFNGNTTSVILAADFVADLPTLYLSKLKTNPNNVKTLQDVRAFTQRTPFEDYPDRDTAVWDQALGLGFNNTSPEFWPYYQRSLQIAGPEGILGLLKNNSLDALILPTDFASNYPARLGTPVVTVPLGFYSAKEPVVKNDRGTLVESGPNIPFGLSFIGPAWSEALLISLAYAYEQKTMTRNKVQPYIKPKTGIADVRGSKQS